MKRLILSAVITLTIPLTLALVAWLLVDVLGLEMPEGVVTLLGYLFGWPLLLLNPLMPASDSNNPYGPLIRMILYVIAVACDFAVYFLLIFFTVGRIWRNC